MNGVATMVDRSTSGSCADQTSETTAQAVTRTRIESLYRDNFAFVVRNAARLGVESAWLDDVAQEVFVVAARRLDEFEGRAAVRTWLFAITLRVVQSHRRWSRRHERRRDAVAQESKPWHDPYPRAQAADTLLKLLDTLPDQFRGVYILAELEGMTAAEIARGLGINPNTTYSRLREARRRMQHAARLHLAQVRARKEVGP